MTARSFDGCRWGGGLKMQQLPVLFRDPAPVDVEHTAPGVGIPRRRPRNTALLVQLLGGPFLAAFDAGLSDLHVAVRRAG